MISKLAVLLCVVDIYIYIIRLDKNKGRLFDEEEKRE